MNSHRPIGGYFELEIPEIGNFLRSEGILLNSGRSCLEYLLKTQSTTLVYLPKYTCDVLLEPLKRLSIEYVFYAIDENMEIAENIELKPNEILIYTNYFGLKNDYCLQLVQEYGSQLVLDCAQAYYFDPPPGSHTFYSPRKFFGLPDGGCLFTDKKLNEELAADSSYGRFTHLLKRIDEGPEAGYPNFKEDDADLSNQPLKNMSQSTRRILSSIDFDTAQKRRLENFAFLHTKLSDKNNCAIASAKSACPMVYPFKSSIKGLRQKLIDAKIFVPLYWPNVLEWCEADELEKQLAQDILPLPIDQRYDQSDMSRIVETITSSSGLS